MGKPVRFPLGTHPGAYIRFEPGLQPESAVGGEGVLDGGELGSTGIVRLRVAGPSWPEAW